jgi:hypothetical protein
MLLLYAQAGEITPEQLDFLTEQLEEEWPDDRDYFINRDMLKILENAGADSELLALLERCLGDRDEVDILWMDTEGMDDSMYRDLDWDWDHEHYYGPAGEISHPPGVDPNHEHAPGEGHTAEERERPRNPFTG